MKVSCGMILSGGGVNCECSRAVVIAVKMLKYLMNLLRDSIFMLFSFFGFRNGCSVGALTNIACYDVKGCYKQ